MVEANTILQCSYLPSIGNIILKTKLCLSFFLNRKFYPELKRYTTPENKLLKHQEKLKIMKHDLVQFNSVAQSCLTLRHHGLQHAKPPCPSPNSGVY